jgi:hypothetical protein
VCVSLSLSLSLFLSISLSLLLLFLSKENTANISYDAYEKDIAMVQVFFKTATVSHLRYQSTHNPLSLTLYMSPSQSLCLSLFVSLSLTFFLKRSKCCQYQL